MKNRRLALIDMGTNTFHLLIAEINSNGEPEPLVKLKESVKLGQDGISRGAIAPDAVERALQTLTNFKTEIEKYEVSEVRAVATSAVRNAANGIKLITAIQEQTGIEVEVISGDREAELIYYGVKSALEIGSERSLIIDIGGGSVECIICDGDTIFWKQSFEIGAQRLMDRFFITDPISAADMEAEMEFLEKELEPLTEAIAQYKPCALIGSSGTFDTLCDIDVRRKGLDRTCDPCTESDLALSDFYEIYDDILKKTRSERLAIPGMMEMRVDMIVVACILIDHVLENYELNKIRVSSYALKEGLLSEQLRFAEK
ncbi:phosphatase [Adhaeribacter arboris]|uniref:Phosphatase n=1 Tax=Adhaeribacter arboris TaxID=2072846 RepID=A0A2T2YFY7_9BACT|nr:phosphatase [Adhaeribacter arboris]PSR54429.1 phosphatase [Adhaeribacter arboris]